MRVACWDCWMDVSDGYREGWQGHGGGSVNRFTERLESVQKVCGEAAKRAAQGGPQCTVVAAGCVWRMDCREQPGSCAPPKEDFWQPLLKAERWVSWNSLIQDASFSQITIGKNNASSAWFSSGFWTVRICMYSLEKAVSNKVIVFGHGL